MFENQKVNEMEKEFGKFADSVGFTNMTPWQSSYDNEVSNKVDPCKEFSKFFFQSLSIKFDTKFKPLSIKIAPIKASQVSLSIF